MKVGEVCNVYGISIWSNVLHYLVFPSEVMLPSWLPADLFEMVEHRVPLDWYVQDNCENADPGLRFLLGYKELALDPSHYQDLINLDRSAIRIFLNRKKEIDDEFSAN